MPRHVARTSQSSTSTVNAYRGEDIVEVSHSMRCAAIQRTVFIDSSALQQRANLGSSEASRCESGGRWAAQTSQESPR